MIRVVTVDGEHQFVVALPARAGAFLARYGEGLAVAVLAFAVALFSSHFRSTPYNSYVRLADAVLHRHLWIDYPGSWLDAVAYGGKHYIVDAPFPALLMLPLVALFGTAANQTTVALLVAALCMWLAHAILCKLGVARTPRLLLLLFLFAGTDLWWCAELGDVWFLAHLCAMAAVFGAILELLGRRRGWLVGLLSLVAFFSRNTELFGIGFFAYALATGDLARFGAESRGESYGESVDVRTSLRSLGALLALGVLMWIGYNEAQWGTWDDIGHGLYFHADSWGQKDGPAFRLSYLPYQVYSYFMRAPIFVEYLQLPQWPYFKVDPNGVALTFTSPALLLAFFAKGPRRLVAALWMATALVAAPNFLYYLNGWYQFGMRHALDFLPYLFVLMALAVRGAMPRWGAVLCVYSAAVGAWGVWWWNAFMRTGS